MNLYTHREDDYMKDDRYCALFAKHMHQMTVEGLHSKAEIAIELAWRDLQLERLREIAEIVRQSIKEKGSPFPNRAYVYHSLEFRTEDANRLQALLEGVSG